MHNRGEGDAVKITSNIFLVGGSNKSDSADAAIYLIRSGTEAALVDAGTGGGTDRVLKNIRDAGKIGRASCRERV